MTKFLVDNTLLFSVTDIFGKKVRTTKNYWDRIKTDKHRELTADHTEVMKTIQKPDEVYQSVQDPYISLFYKNLSGGITLVVVLKYLNGDGFVVTVYETTKVKRKGEKLWPK